MRSRLVTLTHGVLAILAAPVSALRAAVARRQIVGHLASFDDHLLRDIGLTRGDVESVMADTFGQDPTLRLALMVQDARSGRRAAAREQLEWARLVHETDDAPRRAA